MDERERPARAVADVRETYDRIASHFAATREHPWPEVTAFLDRAADRDGPASLALDVGCGNGRHAEPLAAVADRVVGVDASRELLSVARERARERGYGEAFSPVVGDAASVPLRDGVVDRAVYVAALHHLRPRATRVESLRELGRVLASGARGLVSAWSVDHDRFDADAAFDTTVDWTLPGGERVPRFYHVYDAAEFAADLDAAGLSVVRRFVSSGNCYAVVEG
jgi:ubiquinone/menaquinone biosynthesis C-methylase UbiE